MTLLTQNEWEYQRDKDLASLFYYSLRFGNTELVKSTAIRWKERYGEIDSLLYFSEKYEDTITPQLVGYYIIKNRQAFDLINLEMLYSLKSLGLVFHNVADLMILTMKKKNMPLLNFLYEERKEGLKNGTYKVHGHLQGFIPSVIRQSIHSLDLFKHILEWNNQQKDLPIDTALAYGLGHALARDKAEVVAYIKENSSYSKVLSELNFILESKKNEFAMMTKSGFLGDYQVVKDMIASEFEEHLSLNLKEGLPQKLRKI